MNQNSTTKTNQENNNGYEGVFTRALAHVYARAYAQKLSCGSRRWTRTALALLVTVIVGVGSAWGQALNTGTTATTTEFTSSSTTYYTPYGYKITKIEAWGGGGGGQFTTNSTSTGGGRGGGGGAYASVSPTDIPFGTTNTISVTVGGGGAAGTKSSRGGVNGDPSFVSYGGTNYVWADFGRSGGNGGAGGAKNNCVSAKGLSVTKNKGGDGGAGSWDRSYKSGVFYINYYYYYMSGGGGGGAGSTGNDNGAGGDGGVGSTNWSYTSIDVGSGGTGGSGGGGTGGSGGYKTDRALTGTSGATSSSTIGGGGGGGTDGAAASAGSRGQVVITTEACMVNVVFNENNPTTN